MGKDLEKLGIEDYKMALFLNNREVEPLEECLKAGIPDYVHVVIDTEAYKRRAMCFGIRLPNEKVNENLLILKTVYKKEIPDAYKLGDEIIQLMVDDKAPDLSLTMGESLVQAIDAALGVLKGVVTQKEINYEYPLGST